MEAIVRGRIRLDGVNPYVVILPRAARRLREAGKGPIPVLVTVNGQPSPPWRINLVPRSGRGYFLYLREPVRRASQTGVGDLVTVRLRFDEEYRSGPAHPMPPSFSRGLSSSTEARRAWHALPPGRQKEMLRLFASVRSTEARERNVRRALDVLEGKPGRFLGRAWNAPA